MNHHKEGANCVEKFSLRMFCLRIAGSGFDFYRPALAHAQGVADQGNEFRATQAGPGIIAGGLSSYGYLQASAIMQMEPVLGALEEARDVRLNRDEELYFFEILGVSDARKPWSWRIEGHHVSLHFTFVNVELVSNTPLGFGSNPGETSMVSAPRWFSFRRGLPLFLFSGRRRRRRFDFPLLLLPALEYLLLAPHLFFERASLSFVLPVHFFRRRLERRLSPLYSLPVLKRLAFARLLYFELALFGCFTAANLFGGRSGGSSRRFDLARRAVCCLSFNPVAIEDHVAASDFDAALCRAAVHNSLAHYAAS
jgi:hypothetical protein